MKLSITHNFPEVQKALDSAAKQVPFAMATAINKTAQRVQTKLKLEMPKVFDRPTPWVINSLRIKYATKSKLTAEIAYKDRNSAESSRSMIEPHVFGGKRHFGAMEARLRRIGVLPDGWHAVPGGAARLDAYGNMSKGQISQVLNIVGAFTEGGYNKANDKTRAKLAKGNAKKGTYGFEYFVSYGKRGQSLYGLKNNKWGTYSGRKTHLLPGVYQRVKTGFGSSLKPIIIFVNKAAYKKRLDMFGIGERVINAEFPKEFEAAFQQALKTARH